MDHVKRKGAPPVRQTGRCGKGSLVDIALPLPAGQQTGSRHRVTKKGISKQLQGARRMADKRVILKLTGDRRGPMLVFLKSTSSEAIAKASRAAFEMIYGIQEQVSGDLPLIQVHGKRIAKVRQFKNGGSQAIRLPASEAAGVVAWEVERLDDGRLILEPIRERKSAADLLRKFAALKVDLFPEGREAMEFPERGW